MIKLKTSDACALDLQTSNTGISNSGTSDTCVSWNLCHETHKEPPKERLVIVLPDVATDVPLWRGQPFSHCGAISQSSPSPRYLILRQRRSTWAIGGSFSSGIHPPKARLVGYIIDAIWLKLARSDKTAYCMLI